jgi:hypothetical protein
MPFGLRLLLLLLITGCAEQALIVPDADWRTVPQVQRDKIDRQQDADLAAAQAELHAATTSLAAFHQVPQPPRNASAHPTSGSADPNDLWATTAHDHEKSRSEALGRVEAAMADKQRTDLAWRQLRVEAARANLDMVVTKRELTRAQAIDRNMPGNDTYDTAPLRGQFSHTQQRWYAVSTRARAARDAFERASAQLASSKEAYAQLMRSGPIRLREAAIDSDDHSVRLELTEWVILRSDIRRRRGLRRFLDDVQSTTQLRKFALQLSPVLHAAPLVAAASPPDASPPTPAAVPPSAATPPSRTANTATTAAAVPGNKPATSPAPPPTSTSTSNKPAPAAEAARATPSPSPIAEHPADRAAHASSANKPASQRVIAPAPASAQSAAASSNKSATSPAPPPTSPSVSSNKPASPTRNATPSAEHAAVTNNKPATPAAPVPTSPSVSSNKPAGPTHSTASSVDHPADRAAGSPPPNHPADRAGNYSTAPASNSKTASLSGGKPAAPPQNPPPLASKPAGASRGTTSQESATSAAKPVERTMSGAEAPH